MATWCPRLVISSKDHKLEEVATRYQFNPVASSGVVANCNEYDVHLAERPASGVSEFFRQKRDSGGTSVTANG